MKVMRLVGWVFGIFLICLPAHAKKNVILIIPDGCSTSMWAAVRAMTVGADGLLNIDRLPLQGRCRTYSADALITDSAAAATAYASGVKTRNGVLGMNAATSKGDSTTGRAVETILEKAKKAGYATGLVTTTLVMHATPGAFFAHRADRSWYDLLAGDLSRKGVDVVMGGGRDYMIPKGAMDEEGAVSHRSDSRNLIIEMKQLGYDYVYDRVGFDAIDPDTTDRLLGLFNAGDMQYEINRGKDTAGEPSIWEMTDKAIKLLSKNKKGFFLMVEAGLIDHAAHSHMTGEFLWDGIACDKAVGVARMFAMKNRDTLLIVVADHATGGPNFVGMSDPAFPDSVITEGFPKYVLRPDGFPSVESMRPIAIQWAKTTGHTGEDVLVSALGPDAEILEGVIQNTDVFRAMAVHLGVLKTEKKAREIGDIIDP
jgi:alkaline phosphatase